MAQIARSHQVPVCILGHHRPARETPFKSGVSWQTGDGSLLVVFGSSLCLSILHLEIDPSTEQEGMAFSCFFVKIWGTFYLPGLKALGSCNSWKMKFVL